MTTMPETPKIEEVVVLAVPGPSLDASNTKRFKNEMAPVVQSATKLIFDMTLVQFVDSCGLGVILSYVRQLHAKGGQIKVCGLSQRVRSLFELVRMDKVVEIYNTRDEALSASSA
jgi:anti-sigma B factor antagonist